MFTPDFYKGFIAGAVCVLALFGIAFVGFGMLKPWIRMKMMCGKGSLFYVLAMRLRGTPATLIVEAYTTLLHSGEKVNLYLVESQFVANRSNIFNASDLVQLVREHNLRVSDDQDKSQYN